MKKILWSILFVFIFFSCKKEPALPTRVVTDSHLTSFTRYNPANYTTKIDSFTYGPGGQIASYQSWTFDSTANPILTDSDHYAFAFLSGSLLANACIHSWSDTGTPTVQTESHLFYYDSENRLIKDILDSVSSGSKVAKYYNYTDNFISIESTANGGTSFEKDTFFLSAGNVINISNYFFYPGTVNSFLEDVQFSTYANPLHNKVITTSMGAFFSEALSGDFISVNIPKYVKTTNTYKSTTEPGSSNTDATNYVWRIDPDGKIVSGSEPLQGNFYNFRYN